MVNNIHTYISVTTIDNANSVCDTLVVVEVTLLFQSHGGESGISDSRTLLVNKVMLIARVGFPATVKPKV